MKKMFVVGAMFLLCVAGARAAETKTDKDLIGLEQRWVRALEKSDVAAIDELMAATYVDTDEDGHRTDRAGVQAALKSGDLKIASIRLADMHAYVYGNAAVVTGSAPQKATYKGKPVTEHIVFTDTFVQQGGQWKAVASQRSPVR